MYQSCSCLLIIRVVIILCRNDVQTVEVLAGDEVAVRRVLGNGTGADILTVHDSCVSVQYTCSPTSVCMIDKDRYVDQIPVD